MRLRPKADRASRGHLIVTAAVHSPLVADAGAALADRLARAPMHRPALPVWSSGLTTDPDAAVVLGSPGGGEDGLRRRWLAAGAVTIDPAGDHHLSRWGAHSLPAGHGITAHS